MSNDLTSDLRDDTNSMCEALGRLLPRLKSLHLEGENVSPFVFESLLRGPMLPHMESLCLNMTSMLLTDLRYTQYASLGPHYALDIDENEPRTAELLINKLRLQNIIARELRSSYESGRFPSIKLLQFFEFQQHDDNSTHLEWRLNTIDILKECIMVTPTVPVDAVTRWELEEAYMESGIYFNLTAWILVSGSNGQLMFMDGNKFDGCVDLSWITSTTGTRVPASTKFSRKVGSFGFSWVEPSQLVLNREAFLYFIKLEHSEDMSMTAKKWVNFVAGRIRAPYVINGLLEWFD
ncbi:Nn.00g063390.m01.CDS01 [Neocucurbitaria sp. VM-36]